MVGEINEAFVVPRYVKLFYDTYGDLTRSSFLEVGAGNGDLSLAILAESRGEIGRYVTSEYFQEGVDWLQKRGLELVRANAESLPFPDDAFDHVIEFDVMHHVKEPRAMALSMMRVSRGKLLLVEFERPERYPQAAGIHAGASSGWRTILHALDLPQLFRGASGFRIE